MKKIAILAALALFTIFSTNAQSAEKVTELIDAKKAQWSKACYISAVYAGMDDSLTEEDAANYLLERKIIKKIPSMEKEIRFDELTLLVANTFNVKGSLWFSMLKNKRYAFKLFKARRLIPVTSDPQSKVSGSDVLNLFTKCIELDEAEKGAGL